MQALAEALIEIHGQHEHQALLQRTHQLALLDTYGGHSAERDRVAELATRWRAADAEILRLSGGQDHSERIAMLDGSHLFPMEKPLATAAAVEAALRNLL